MPPTPDDRPRCDWPGEDPLYLAYHDEEWGVPVHDERKMFEFLVLESFQAGLSWITILRKREAFRAAFAGFDAEAVASFGDADIARLLADAGIVRNRAKILAAIGNAKCTLELRAKGGGLVGFFWDHVGGKPIINRRATLSDLPATTKLAETIAKDMKRLGFRFLGPTTIYAHLQAAGLVNDHLVTCYRHSGSPLGVKPTHLTLRAL
jgi:DNA-3-methyladenine glycosylase I